MFRILIDDREDETHPHFDDLGSERKCEAGPPQRLVTGDYAVYFYDILRVLIERKTWDDLAGSIVNGRLDEQLARMATVRSELADPGQCTLILLVEGTPRKIHKRIPMKNLIAKLDHIMFRNEAHIIYTCDPRDTARRVYRMVDNLNVDLTYRPAVKAEGGGDGNDVRQNEEEKHALPRVDIPDDLTQQRPREDVRVVVDMLSAVPQLALNTARVIVAAGWSVRSMMQRTVAEIAELTYESGTHIGETRARKIHNSLRSAKCWSNILTTINGITKKTAAEIVAELDYKKVAEWTADGIANVHKTEKKTVGHAMGARVIVLLDYSN